MEPKVDTRLSPAMRSFRAPVSNSHHFRAGAGTQAALAQFRDAPGTDHSTRDQDHVAVVFACDQAYAMPLATALRSIVEARCSERPLEVYVLAENFSESARAKLLSSLPAGSVSLHWVTVDSAPFGVLSTQEYISKITFARLLIPWKIPESISRVLYLDADLLVLDDVSALFATDLEGAAFGAVLCRLDAHFKSGKPGFEGAPVVQHYFNAGVLLIDLEKWRNEQISEKALEYIARHPQSPLSDQDALNAVYDGRWKQLDARWNVEYLYHEYVVPRASAEKMPGIIHFIGCYKPWDARVLNPNASFYDSFRIRTSFARTPQDKLRDAIKGAWPNSKRFLGRSQLLRLIQSRFLKAKEIRPLITASPKHSHDI